MNQNNRQTQGTQLKVAGKSVKLNTTIRSQPERTTISYLGAGAANIFGSLLIFALLATLLSLATTGANAIAINIWKHRYPFYGGYGGYYPFWGGYGGYGGGYGGIGGIGGINIGGYGR